MTPTKHNERPSGLYCYTTAPIPGSPGARSWRPDLVPVLLEWLAGVPETDLQYCTGFDVSSRGGFAMTFEKAPRTGGPVRQIVFRVDHGTSSVENETQLWRHDTQIIPYSTTYLLAAASTPR